MKYLLSITILILVASSCSHAPVAQWTSTTPDSCFVNNVSIQLSNAENTADIIILENETLQTVEGFGGCFNEMGWVTLSALEQDSRELIIKDLFGEHGANFTLCRMPMGANDFSIDWYSYNETENDFAMDSFSIDNDTKTLIPFIRAAQKINPNLKIWASPWSPPSWMKYNKHYACKPNPKVNDLKGDPEQDLEGTNMFIQEPRYLEAYSLYFQKFIEAYREQGINISMVAPQNEFNSCQIFPSCTWTASGLSTFIGEYLGPKMQDMKVDLMFGTTERKNHLLVDTIMKNESGQYISQIGFQWAGKEAISEVQKTYPNLKLMQTESECGNGDNSWEQCFYIWDLMKHYFENGISSYMYWNISLDINPANNRWKWAQNSLISVDQVNKTYRYNPEYYLMKQFSHFIKPGAKRVRTQGEYDDVLAFKNPNGSIIVIVANQTEKTREIAINVTGQSLRVELRPQSINTFTIPDIK